ncbi:MAG: hypothetical protein AAF555_01785 [Verrucomicrobiota bacterium]
MSEDELQIRERAWVGDAVLCLFARRWVLAQDGKMDGERVIRLTSNKFLSALGNPTKVEAQIGAVFEQEGLSAAFQHIETALLPLFLKQEKNRRTLK